MAGHYPDVPSKLGNPTKKSLFERQREEAEAKKAREKAETAAALEDFVKSFDDETEAPKRQENVFDRGGGRGGPPGSGSVPGLGKRHFTSLGLKSGPGSLGPSPSTPRSGPGGLNSYDAGYSRKRPYEDFKGRRRDQDGGHGMFSYEDERSTISGPGFRAEDDNEEGKDPSDTKASKPTLHLSSLPPGTSPAVINALFVPSPLNIEDVRILPPYHHNSGNIDRKSTSAIVTLAPETPATEIDTMVSHLQNRYLGFGFNLVISRHLSSAALSGATAIPAPSASLPFNARPIPQTGYSLSRAPPPGQSQGRFAPPASYTSSTPYAARSNAPATQVVVIPPSDLGQLKLIHKTLEALLTHGPEFEALLMSMPHIQRSEKWAWLFNPRSAGGVYYRWRLWDTIASSTARRRQRQSAAAADHVFEGQSAWVPPEQNLKFEYTTEMEEFVSDSDYDSSDEEDDDGGIARRYNDHTHASGGPPLEGMTDGDGTGYLNPLAKTKLVHLLARLPKSNAKLRRGDVARVTGFAIEHAGSGADELSEIIASNVVRPLSSTGACGTSDSQDDVEEDRPEDKADTTSASLVGLYVISDILSSSASAGVRHAWRYRALFEAALRSQSTFERLGRIDKDLGWGKLKAEKWKRSVQSILTLWEGWCVFPQTSHDEFVKSFLEPPLSAVELARVEAEEQRKNEEALHRSKSAGSRWKTVDDKTPQDVHMEDVDGQLMSDTEDVDGHPMDEDDVIDENIDGMPMVDSSDDEVSPNTSEEEQKVQSEEKPATEARIGLLNPRQRSRAVDMFADEDSGGE